MKKFVFALLFSLFLVNLFLIIFSHFSLHNHIIQNRPLLKDLNNLKAEINYAHLWTEEYIIGDKFIDIEKDILIKIEKQIKKFQNYKYQESEEINKNIRKVIVELIEFYRYTKQRLNSKTIAGSDDDEQYDRLYEKLSLSINDTLEHLQKKVKNEFESNNIYFYFSVFLFIFFNIATFFTIYFLIKKEEKNNEKNAHQQKLNSLAEMLTNIAHQWRQPLSTISTAASGVKLKKELGERVEDKELEDSLDTIVKSAMYLSKTIDDFSSYVKVSNAVEMLNLEEIVEKTLETVHEHLDFNHIEVIKKIEQKNDRKYRSELIQILTNIINNAKDELKTKEGNRFIFIDIKQKSDKTVIYIKDNGGGIDEKIIDKIFEPYFTTKHQAYGTGLGLSMSVKMIEALDGKIEVENVEFKYKETLYKGACFRVLLG